MECQNNNKRRQSIRLKNFDYASSGAYFITLCTQDRECMFGVVYDDTVILNDIGQKFQAAWIEAIRQRPIFSLDEYVLMPNHFHAIVWIKEKPVGADLCGMSCSYNSYALPSSMKVVCPCEAPAQTGQTRRSAPTSGSLFELIQRFKTFTTTMYIKGVKIQNWKPFHKRVWQRNYYERVIRNEAELNNIRQYILDNPKNWETDEYF